VAILSTPRFDTHFVATERFDLLKGGTIVIRLDLSFDLHRKKIKNQKDGGDWGHDSVQLYNTYQRTA
jgi:hypothetical protein